jgi:hypothetical protein
MTPLLDLALLAVRDATKERPSGDPDPEANHEAMKKTALSALRAVLAFSLVACGASSTPPADSPASPKPTAKAEKPPEKVAETQTEEPAEKDPRADGLRKASRPPAELITGPNLVYMFNFKESAVGKEARERCSEQAGDSPRELAACMEKARSKVQVESVRFVKESSGEHFFITYNRYKGNLLKWHKVQFMPGEETADRITLNLIGKDKGIAPMARVPRSISIELPNDYTIVVEDPDHGAMMYDAKIGTLEDN